MLSPARWPAPSCAPASSAVGFSYNPFASAGSSSCWPKSAALSISTSSTNLWFPSVRRPPITKPIPHGLAQFLRRFALTKTKPRNRVRPPQVTVQAPMVVGSASFGVMGYLEVQNYDLGGQGSGLTLSGCASICAGLSTCVVATLASGTCWPKTSLVSAVGTPCTGMFLLPSGTSPTEPRRSNMHGLQLRVSNKMKVSN